MRTKPMATTHDEYLATVPEDKRAVLEKLREIIRSAAPRAEECMSYQLPCVQVHEELAAIRRHSALVHDDDPDARQCGRAGLHEAVPDQRRRQRQQRRSAGGDGDEQRLFQACLQSLT